MIDPLDLAIARGRLQQIVDEMDLVHVRAAFSVQVSEAWDRANAVIDYPSGEVVVQGTTSLPIFIYTMQAVGQACLAKLGARLRDGDVLLVNDPYLGGTHLQDFKMLRPVFHEGEIVVCLINTTHIVDVGGSQPGGFDPATTDVFQEGLQIPPVWLIRRGRWQRDLLDLVLRNTRMPERQEGDLRAQLNALTVGHRGVKALIDEYGVRLLRECVTELAERSEQQMRSCLRRIPPGEYRFSDRVESTASGEDLTIRMRLEIGDGDAHIDLTGSSPQIDEPLNLPAVTTKTSILCAFKHMFPDVPINGGCFRPFRFTLPEGSFVNAAAPRPVGGYAEVAIRVLECVFGALGSALPEAGYAASFGTAGVLAVSGVDDDGNFFSTVFPLAGGLGGCHGYDGLPHAPTTIGLARLPSLEATEHELPIIWEAMELRPDSGGAGRWRGGPGTVFRLRATRPVTVSVLGDRARHAPFGVGGGQTGATLEISTTHGRSAGSAKLRGTRLAEGEYIEVRMPGGGGFGSPLERDRQALELDLERGFVSEKALSTVWST